MMKEMVKLAKNVGKKNKEGRNRNQKIEHHLFYHIFLLAPLFQKRKTKSKSRSVKFDICL